MSKYDSVTNLIKLTELVLSDMERANVGQTWITTVALKKALVNYEKMSKEFPTPASTRVPLVPTAECWYEAAKHPTKDCSVEMALHNCFNHTENALAACLDGSSPQYFEMLKKRLVVLRSRK